MKRILQCLLLLIALPTASQTTLSLDECIRLAKENNKSIRAAEYGLQAASMGLKSTKGLFFPSVEISGSFFYTDAKGSLDVAGGNLPAFGPTGNIIGSAYFPGLSLGYDINAVYNANIILKQPIFTGGKIRAGYEMSKSGRQLALQNRRLTESEVIVETSRAYAGLVRANEMHRVAEAYHKLLSELMRNVESAKRHGMKPQNDVLKVKVKLNESLLNLKKTDNASRLAAMNLCHYIGRPLSERIVTVDSLPDIAGSGNERTDIMARPEYAMLQEQCAIAARQVQTARSEYLPQIGLFGQYGYANGIDFNGSRLLDDWSFMVGLQVSIPLFDCGHKVNKIKTAKAKHLQLEAERENTVELLTLEMTQTRNNLEEAQLELELADLSVTSADENLRMSQRQYEAGMETLTDLLEAQALWQQARQTQVDARVNCYLQWLEFRKATGQIN